MDQKKSLKAGALNYAILLSIIAAATILLLLVWQEKQAEIHTKHKHQFDLRQNCFSAWNMLKNLPIAGQEYVKIERDLFDEGCDSINIINRQWGAFQTAVIRAQRMGFHYKTALIYGVLPHEKYQNVALYTTGKRYPLHFAGKVRIYGDVYAPQPGIKAAYIEGKTFPYKRMVRGQIYKREKNEIKPDVALENYAKRLAQFQYLPEDSLVFEINKNIRQPWEKRTIIFEPKRSFFDFDTLQGNLILSHRDSVVINATCGLNDVLINAKKVRIKDGFSGRLHIVATDTVILEENVTLAYPSSIILMNKNPKMQTQIRLKKGVQFSGVIISEDRERLSKTSAKVVLDSGSVVIGQVIANSQVEPKGKIMGQLFAEKIILHTRAGIYANHLLDCEINKDSLDIPFAGSGILGDEKYVAAWLN